MKIVYIEIDDDFIEVTVDGEVIIRETHDLVGYAGMSAIDTAVKRLAHKLDVSVEYK